MNNFLLLWISSLCFQGAYLGTLCLLEFQHLVTAFTTVLMKSLVHFGSGNFVIFFSIALLPIMFLVGTIISGLIFPPKFSFGKLYGVYVLILGVMLLITVIFLYDTIFFLSAVTMIAGMQNSMLISYDGIHCRTTHLTGAASDFGVLIGQRLKKKDINCTHFKYYFYTFGGSVIGMIIATIIHNEIQEKSFLSTPIIYFLIGIVYLIKRKKYTEELQ